MRVGSPAGALDPSGSRPTAARSAPTKPRSSASARRALWPAIRCARSALDLNDARGRVGDREAVESADAAADAGLGPDQRPARAPRRDRRPRRSGRRSSRPPRRSGCARSWATPTGGRTEPPAATCCPRCFAATTAATPARLAPARRRRRRRYVCAQRPGLRRLRQDDDHRRRRSSSSSSRPSCTGSTRPSLPRALNGTSRPTRRRGVAGGDRARRRRSWTSWPSCGPSGEIRPQRVAEGARPDREAARRGQEAPRRDQPHDRAGAAPRQRRRSCASSGQTMTLTRQQQIVAALLDHVVVGPARRGFNRFDPSRLTAVWRVLSPSARAAPPRREAPRGPRPSPAAPARARSPRPRPARLRAADHPAQAHQYAGGPRQPSRSDERQTRDGGAAHPLAGLAPAPPASERPCSGTRSGWKPCATS